MPFRITDETAAATVIEVADGGQRIGINGAADASGFVTVGGTVFIAGNSRYAAATVPSLAVSPGQSSVTVAANSTTTITATSSFNIPSPDSEGLVTNIGSTSFTLGNRNGSSVTMKYTVW